MTAIMDKEYYENDLNSVYEKFSGSVVKLGTSDSCEIRIVKNGICSVNKQLIKHKIVIKHSPKLKSISGLLIV